MACAVGLATDETGHIIPMVVSLMFPASTPFIGHMFGLNVTSNDSSAAVVNQTLVLLGWTHDGVLVNETALFYAGVDDLLVDGPQTSTITFGPLVNMSSGTLLSNSYTLRQIVTHDNDGMCGIADQV